MRNEIGGSSRLGDWEAASRVNRQICRFIRGHLGRQKRQVDEGDTFCAMAGAISPSVFVGATEAELCHHGAMVPELLPAKPRWRECSIGTRLYRVGRTGKTARPVETGELAGSDAVVLPPGEG
jgi:hypothetical protein